MVEKGPKMKRLNVNLPDGVHEDLRILAERSGRSMTEIVRTGLGLVRVALEEAERNNTLAVTNAKGLLVKQIVLPS